jgi:hypothetical protein
MPSEPFSFKLTLVPARYSAPGEHKKLSRTATLYLHNVSRLDTSCSLSDESKSAPDCQEGSPNLFFSLTIHEATFHPPPHRVRRFRLYIFFASKRKKSPIFSLSFALSEYERRTLGAPVSLIYFFRFMSRDKYLYPQHVSILFSNYVSKTKTINADPGHSWMMRGPGNTHLLCKKT